MSCAACSTKSLRHFLRSFSLFESHERAQPRLPYNVRSAPRRPFHTSSSDKYRSSLRASNQLQLSGLSTKLDDTYLPFVKPAADAEDNQHFRRWISASVTNTKSSALPVPVDSLVIARQSAESRIYASQSPDIDTGTGVLSGIASTNGDSEAARDFGTKPLRAGKASINQQHISEEASQHDVVMASVKRASRFLGVAGPGKTALKPASPIAAGEPTRTSTRGGGRRRETSVRGSAQAELRKRPVDREREVWQTQKSALAAKFGSQGWAPRKRLSPDALDGIRALHSQYPDRYTTPVLADQFKISPEAVRRILKSKWRPSEEEEEHRRQRWDKRGEVIWGQMVEIGIKPPKKWREMGVGISKGEPTTRQKRRASPNRHPMDGAQGSRSGSTDPGGPEYDAFVKGSLADRIL
ncbi:Required for respiratory growth protein 9 mitochondrial [Hypocenomyce scalaris]|nr:Required for respiratory growth protein 9 mitochondrial [Hypocenomyce scalaris]